MDINKEIKKFSIVDNETGEVIREFKNGDKIISKEQSEAYKNKVEEEKRLGNFNRDKRHFSFGKMKRMKEISEKLDAKKCGYIMKLIPFMQFGTGYLLKEDGSVMATKTDIGNGLGVSKVSSRNGIINALIEASVIDVDEVGYKMNPDVHIRSVVSGNELIKLFKTTLEKLSNDLKPAELGYLYKLLPYVHFETNLICIDPFEEKPENFKFLNQQEIAKLLGMELKNAKKLLTLLRKKGILAQALSEADGRNKKFYVNPYVFFRKRGYPDDTLKSMFFSTPYSSRK